MIDKCLHVIHVVVLIFGLALLIVYHKQFDVRKVEEVSSVSSNSNLLIGILSSRYNFENREAIRKSWGAQLQNYQNIHMIFFVGKPCSVPLQDRLDELACAPSILGKELHTSFKNEVWGNIVCKDKNKFSSNPITTDETSYTGFGFHVRHSLTLISIGVQKEVFELKKSVFVTFRDAEETFEYIKIDDKSCSLVGEFCFIRLNHSYHLPKGFEGEISLSGFDISKLKSKLCTWYVDDVFRFTFGKNGNDFVKFDKEVCTYIMANFSLADKDALLTHVSEKIKRQAKWDEGELLAEGRLRNEIETFDDVVYFTDVIDVYRNLPQKLTQMLKWANTNHPGAAFMKVDDDTVVNASLLMNLIPSIKSSKDELVIWSHFYYHRSVPRFGKWADLDYIGLTYPPFPSGSGYILSGSLSSLLSKASHFLSYFQGEDVSMGIWTEALGFGAQNVMKKNVRCWLPSKDCQASSVLVPNLTPEQMLDKG